MKDGVRIVNCARGGMLVEADLRNAIESGKVAGAAIDVFAEEPANENILFGLPQVIATPHLGAATSEAQENVALQVAEQMSDYLLSGAVSNAINMPSVTAEEAPHLKPYMSLAEKLGSFAGQLTMDGPAGHCNRIPRQCGDIEHAAADFFGNRRIAASIARQYQYGQCGVRGARSRHRDYRDKTRAAGRL